MIFRKLKMRSVMIAVVALSVFLGLALLLVLASTNSNTMLRDKINDNMSTYLSAQEKAIEKFVEESEQKLILFSKSKDIEDILLEDAKDRNSNPDRTPENENAEYFSKNLKSYEAAQSYTMSYFNSLHNWEGLYISNENTTVLTYNAVPVIGRTLRTGDSRKELMDAIEANKNGVYDAGIMVSKGSGQLCLSMYAGVVKDDDIIGYVGAGVFNTELEDILDSNEISGISQSEFFMLNSQNGTLFIATDEAEKENITLETENPVLREVMSKISAGEANGHFEFRNENYKNGQTIVVNYESVPGRDWAVVLTADKDGLYEDSNKNLRNMVIIGAIAFALILALVAISITLLTNPLVKVTGAIKELGKLNLDPDKEVIKRASDRNEVGEIAHEIEELRISLNGIVNTLKGCSSSLDSSAGSMSVNSKDLVGFVSDNTATTQELAASLSSTGSIVDQVNGNIKRMNTLVEEVANSVKEGSEQSGNILAAAESMEQKSAQTLIESKKNISDNKAAVQEVMTKLRNLSKINTFVNDILSIATQTKLLSLNASIEAARAGEQGKGFSVVATEIGTLASNTSSAAQKIQDITRLTNESIDETVKCFDELNEYLESDIMMKFEEFNAEAQNNNKITNGLINNINEVSRNIAEFKSFVNELVEQMDEIKMLSEQNSAGIDDIVDKNEHTSKIAEDMVGAVTVNKDNAQALSDIISKFNGN